LTRWNEISELLRRQLLRVVLWMKKNESTVRRITVDERLDDNLIRILVSELCEEVNVGELVDDNIWDEETSLLVSRIREEDIRNKVSRGVVDWLKLKRDWEIPERISPKWDDLYEGQVYLQGAYSLKKENDRIMLYRNPKIRHVVRIDLVPNMKEHRDSLYNLLLLRRAGLA
jgi:hypothetical protein